MDTFIRLITRVLSVFLIFLMAVIVLDVSWQVFTRFILKDPSSFTEELAGFLLIWIGLLGSSYAFYTRAHLGIDVLTMRFKPEKKKIVGILISVIVFLFALIVLVIGGLRLVDLTFTLDQVSPAIGVPMGYVYLVLPLTGLLVMIYAVYFIAVLWRREEYFQEEQKIRIVE